MALLLAAVMAFSALPAAMAEEGVSPSPDQGQETVIRGGDGETGYVLRESRDELGGGMPGYSAAQTFGAASSTYDDGTMYSQLTQRQKACYDALEGVTIDRILKASASDGYQYITVRVDDFYGVLLSGKISGSLFTAAPSSESLEAGIYTDLCAAIVALRYDRADILWISDMRYGYKWLKQKDDVVKVTDALFAFKLVYGGQEKKMWEAMNGEAAKIAAQVDAAADTYTQVKAVHDILAQRNTYNDKPAGNTDEALSHTAYSALIGGDAYEPVCDGYAKAFKVVCGLLNIPCALASSETHMWNNVKMDDGDWYNLDLTWDDSNDEETRYDYFLIGSQTVVEGEMFSKQKDHVEENPYKKEKGLNALTLKFPAKNKEAYQYLGEEYPQLRFPDVKRSAWFYEYVESAAELGLFKGDKDGMFLPGNKITRAEFVQVMANSMGADLSAYTEPAFTDVKAGQWYVPAVGWAKATGLMKGYKDGTFHPNAPISREEMCVVLYNAKNSAGSATEAPDGSFAFPDDKSIAAWAKTAVYTCYDLGLVKGDTKGNFAPKANTLRSEAATVFTRYAGLDAA